MKAYLVLALVLCALAAHVGADEQEDQATGCGPHGEAHDGHCDCEPGFVELEGKCVDEGAKTLNQDNGDSHDEHDEEGHEEHDEEGLDCGKYGYSHGDHCDCQTGYVFDGKSCIAAEKEGDHEHDDPHNEGRPNWPDCECMVPNLDCTDVGGSVDTAIDQLRLLNCSTDGACEASTKCQAAFFVVNAAHDGCPNDALSTENELLYHRYAANCPNCHALVDLTADAEPHDAVVCPYINCNDTAASNEAWNTLMDNCTASCGEDMCMGAWHYAIGYHALCPETVTFEQSELFHLLEDLCEHACKVDQVRDASCTSPINARYQAVADMVNDLLVDVASSNAAVSSLRSILLPAVISAVVVPLVLVGLS